MAGGGGKGGAGGAAGANGAGGDRRQDYKVDKFMLEKVNSEIDMAGKVPDAVFENMMKNTFVKAEVLRELANTS